MTDQEVFDKVSSHLLTQGCKSIGNKNVNIICKYRSSNGLKCAIGCLIPDEDYDPMTEGHGVNEPGDTHFLLNNILIKLGLTNYKLLRRLQWVHDRCDFMIWKNQLSLVAHEYKLSGEILYSF